MKKVGFDHYAGRDEVPEMKEGPRVVQYSPPDDYLYRHARKRLQTLKKQSKPYFMTLVTSSTHLKYTHPYGGENTAEAVWEWTLGELRDFYKDLKSQGFLENGLFIVTGDHRIMRPVNDEEVKRYGDSAKARIPLLILGRGVSQGKVDTRFFQQSDLFPKLKTAIETDRLLSPNPIWVDRYTKAWGILRKTGQVTVFDETSDGKKGYHIYLSGRHLRWLG